MIFEYDRQKSASNKRKHGVDFEEAKAIWEKAPLLLEGRDIEEEQRYLAIGLIGEKIHTAIYVKREGRIRIISCRRARKNEEELYEATKTYLR
jgi:uncharacterized DUF497 family protein